MKTIAANFWGRFAALKNHNSGPALERENPMATVTKIPPIIQTETATINWLNQHIDKGKIEPHYALAIIVPGVAAAMLANNENNRNLSDRKVQEYARDMIQGRWTLNGEPVIIADTGELNDGQHRLQAIIESNVPQKLSVGFGFPRESRTTVDQGMARTSGHYLAMQGVANSSLCAGITQLVMAYERTGGRDHRDRTSTHAEVVARVLADHSIGDAAAFTMRVRKFAKGLLTPSQIGFCFYIFYEINPNDAADFITQVCVGENIKRGDPAFAVRQALAGLEGEQRLARIEIVMRGWVAYRQNRKLQLAKVMNVLPALV